MLVATVASLTVAAAGASTASAYDPELSIPFSGCQDGTGRWYDYVLRVRGTTRYALGSRVEVRLWGSDSWSDDDFLGGPYTQDLPITVQEYLIDFCADSSTLDEDVGLDEIYAEVRVYDRSTGALKQKLRSNEIHRYF
jgi:hypothetical protein